MKEIPYRSLPDIPFLLALLVASVLAGSLFLIGIGPNPKTQRVPSGLLLIAGLDLGLIPALFHTLKPHFPQGIIRPDDPAFHADRSFGFQTG